MTVRLSLGDVWYNEIDPFAADWLEQLIQQGHIAPGVVDRRSIVDVKPSEIAGFKQCHFFAGVGVWSYALRLAGWSDDRPIWTGSCPCQPFSAAGKGSGFDDERHLWPFWQYLIEQCGPPEIAGEQVASKDGYAWLDLVQSDLEGMGYACGAIVSPSAGYGAPHERHRQFFGAKRGVFHATSDGRQQWRTEPGGRGIIGGCGDVRLADDNGNRCTSRGIVRPFRQEHDIEHGGTVGNVADSDGARGAARLPKPEQRQKGYAGKLDDGCRERARTEGTPPTDRTGPTNGFWSAADWLRCRDERWRPVEPGTFPLANGASARVGRLRGYGNAINAQQAKAFIEAFDSHSFGSASHVQ